MRGPAGGPAPRAPRGRTALLGPDEQPLAELAVVDLAPPSASIPMRGPAALARELAQAEELVIELDREVRGGPEPSGSDETLAARAAVGDQAALEQLLHRYRSFARVKARSYFLAGADREDVVQEGMIGLYKAIRDFEPAHQSSFRAFADLCVTRQVITAVKAATRHKHGPLNCYVSLSQPLPGANDDERVLADVLPALAGSDPADLVISAERIRALQAHVDEVLSDLETEVLRLYVEGKSYTEIAERLQRQVKTIDNALQRIKKKLEQHLEARSRADRG